MLIAAGLLGAAILWAGVRDRRILVAALSFTVVTNASNAVETEYGVQGYLLPLALLVLVLATWDRIALVDAETSRPDAGEPGHGALVGTALVATTVFSAVIGPFVSDHPSVSSFYVGLLLKDLVVVVALVLAVVDRSTFRAALVGLAAGGTTLASITVAQMTLGLQDDPVGGFGRWTTQEVAGVGETARAAGTFINDPNSYAQHLVVAFGAAVGLAIVGGRTALRVSMAIGAGVIVVAMAGTSSRTGFLAIAVVGALATWFARPTRTQLAAVGAGAAVVVIGPFGVWERLATLGDIGSVGTSTADASLTGRTSEAIAALDMFTAHPLTGVGYGAYPAEYLDAARRIGYETRFEERSAHSLPLEIAAEQGFLGVAAWGALAVFVVWVARRLVGCHRREGLGFALALAGFATTAVFLHDVHPRVMWLLIALAVAGARLIDRHAVAPPPPSAVADRPVVAMVIQHYVPALGGAERQLANSMPRLVAAGVRPVVITRHHPGRPERDEVDGVPVVRLRVFGPKPVRSLMFVVRARIELRRLRPDVVHAFDTLTPSTIAIGHRRTYGTPVVTKLLRSGELGDLAVLERKPAGRRRVRDLVANVDRFVAISSDIVDELERLGVTPDRILRIPNGVDTTTFSPPGARRRARSRAAVPRVIATGRLAPEKRLVDVAERWDRVVARCATARLVLVGDGPEREALETFDRVEVLGQRDDVPGRLRASTVYVSASSGEGLSNSLLEAMASGLPCVVTDVGGVRDVIDDGVHGVIVGADDLDGLVDEVGRLLTDEGRRARLGTAARRRVCDRFSLDATASSLANEYRRLACPSATARDAALTSPTGSHEDPAPVEHLVASQTSRRTTAHVDGMARPVGAR